MNANAAQHITVRAIVHRVATARRIHERHIYSRRIDPPVSDARHAVYWLARDLPGLSSAVVGRMLNRDGSTVRQGAKLMEERRLADAALAAELEGLKSDLMISARAALAGMLTDPDPLAAAERVSRALDPIAAGLRVTALEVAAMAARLVDLEDVAGGTFQLLARCDHALTLSGDAARDYAAGTRDLITAIAEALAALGYDDQQEAEDGEEKDDGHEPACAAE